MFDIDDRLAEFAANSGELAIALAIAVLLGLRHATDPDHLTALSTLVLSDEERGARRAARLGLAWGVGHAVTLLLLGLPVVLFSHALPDWAQRAAEALIGVVIVMLGLRLLLRWRHGYFHAHPHEHPHGMRHLHLHVHDQPRAEHDRMHGHDHPHEEAFGRSAPAAFAIGLIHGAGGSAGAGIILIAGIDSHRDAAIALLLFAAGTAVSMALASAAWGRLLISTVVERRLTALAPVFGTASLAFGAWYGLGALS